MAFWRKAAEDRGLDDDLNNDIAYNNNIHLLPYLYDQSSQMLIWELNATSFVKYRSHKRPQEASEQDLIWQFSSIWLVAILDKHSP